MTDPPHTSSQRSIPGRDAKTSETGRKGWPTTVIVFIGLLLILEGALRVLEPSIPTPLDWPTADMQEKFEQITNLGDDRQTVDIAFVGSSVVNQSIDPVAFTDAANGIVSYNAAIGGAISPKSWRWWINEVVVPRLQPQVIVIGVASLDLNSGLADAFWGGLSGSRGFLQVDNEDSWTARFKDELHQRVALFRLRTVLRQPLRILVGFGETNPIEPTIGPYGAEPAGRDFEPYEVAEPKRRDLIDRELKDFRTQGPNLEELEGLVQDLQSQGVGVVLLNMPVTDDYIARHPNGMRDYTRYLGELADLARRRNIRFLDFGNSVSSLELFRNPTHLNQTGAALFSRDLADALADGTK